MNPFEIVSVSHGINIYPAFLENHVATDHRNTGTSCKDETQLLAELEKVLGSPEVHRVVSSLLALSKAGPE